MKSFLFLTILLNINNCTLFAAFKFDSQSSTLQLSGPGAKIIMSTPINNFNGTLKISEKTASSISATSTDNRLTFFDGVYQANTSGRAYVNATIDPLNTDSIILNSGQSISVENGAIVEAILVRGTGSSINGQPTFNSPLVLQDVTTTVTMCIQNKLNQNIVMNGGTVVLGNDLTLQDGIYFAGSGTINLAKKMLTLPTATSTSWTDDLRFLQASNILLTGFTNISGQWTFSGTNDTSTLNGSGSILDLTAGGNIVVDTDHTLYINDLHIKGLGSSHGNININPGGTLYLANVTLELAGNYTLSAGTIVIAGSNCTLIAKNHDQFIVSGATTLLTIDGVAMLYDPLGTTPLTPTPFSTNSGGTITYQNGGVIRASYSTTGGGSIEFTIPSSVGTEQLSENHTLTTNAQMFFLNEDPSKPKSITLDGRGLYIQFNYTTGKFITLQENLTVTLHNTMLKDFDPALVDFQGSGATRSKFIFGDNVVVGLGNDLFAPTIPFNFEGVSTLRGNGTTLTLDRAHMLTANTPGCILTVKNIKLVLTDADAMECLDNNATIALQDSEVMMRNEGINFALGNLDIKGYVFLSGMDPTTPRTSATFNFSSAGFLKVQTSSIFQLDNRANLLYNPDVSNDLGNLHAAKRHLQLVDPSATLSLNTCSLTSGTMGLALDYGRLLVNGQTTLCVNATPGAEVEFGSALSVELAPGGILDIEGALMYTDTTYP